MPRDEFPTVLIVPLLVIVFDPPVAWMASELVLPLVVIVPLLITVFEPPEALTPLALSPVGLMLPVFVMMSVLLPVRV